MARRIQKDRGDVGSILASAFVVSLGAGCCFCLILALSPNPEPVVLAALSCIVGGYLLLISLHHCGQPRWKSLAVWNASNRSHHDDGLACQYRPRRIADRKALSVPAPGRPIDVSEVREIRETSMNTWVPSRGKSGGKA